MTELLKRTAAYLGIRAAAERGELFHAALVVFPDGKYLGDLLKECAKAFFGAEEGRIAELIQKESFSDCLFFPAEGEKLTADDCTRIVDESLLRPVEGERKLFVLGNFHTAAALVQNKLLKSLEEPPEGVSFLLGAETESPILPTVLSRVKKYVVPPFSEEQIAEALTRKYGPEGVRACAAASGGIFSVAEALLKDGGEDFRLAEEFLSLNESEKFCREMGERKSIAEFLAALKSVLRDMLFLSLGKGEYAARRTVSALAAEYPTGALISAQGFVMDAEREIKFNANIASCLYALAMRVKEEKTKWQRLS